MKACFTNIPDGYLQSVLYYKLAMHDILAVVGRSYSQISYVNWPQLL